MKQSEAGSAKKKTTSAQKKTTGAKKTTKKQPTTYIQDKSKTKANRPIPPKTSTSSTRTTSMNKKRMLEALKVNLGIVTAACNACGVKRATHHAWMRSDIKYKTSVEEMDEVCLDFAEASLLRQIKNDVTSSTIFYLKTKGKKRGYVETNINITHDSSHQDFTKYTDEELDEIIKYGYIKSRKEG